MKILAYNVVIANMICDQVDTKVAAMALRRTIRAENPDMVVTIEAVR